MKRSFTRACIALLLATNYFAFQVELCESEYEANHPKQERGCFYSGPTLTWESFDKDNAPPAFVFDAGLRIDCLLILTSPRFFEQITELPFQPIRDKSPPSSFVLHNTPFQA